MVFYQVMWPCGCGSVGCISAVRLRAEGGPMNAAGVREELERILASPGFDASARNRRFLEYIVEETLAGRADRLKGLTIAIDVFGRDGHDRSAARSGGPHRGGQAAPEPGTLLPDRRPRGPDSDRHSEGRLRADLRGAGTPVPGLARPGGRTCRGGGAAPGAPRREAALALAHDRPPRRLVARGAGMAWRGPARFQIAARRQPRTPRRRCLGVPRSPCCPSSI